MSSSSSRASFAAPSSASTISCAVSGRSGVPAGDAGVSAPYSRRPARRAVRLLMGEEEATVVVGTVMGEVGGMGGERGAVTDAAVPI